MRRVRKPASIWLTALENRIELQKANRVSPAGTRFLPPPPSPLAEVCPQPTGQTADQAAGSDAPSSPHGPIEPELICIPEEARGHPIRGLPISVRLDNVLLGEGFKLLGDLHGLPYMKFVSFRNFGKHSLKELRALVRSVQQGQLPVPVSDLRTTLSSRAQVECFLIPESARGLKLADLPLSVRLEGLLGKKGITRLGDLHQVPVRDIRVLRNCGMKSLKELAHLIERAAAGEFQPAIEPFSTSQAGGLLLTLDELLATLRPRDREILLLRLGARAGCIWTLGELASTFGITTERVRQILKNAPCFVRKHGGPRLVSSLQGIASVCHKLARPLTPALLSQWLGGNARAAGLPFAVYVRLLAELNPEIPA